MKLLRFDDPGTIVSLYRLLADTYNKTKNDRYVKLAKMLQFATSVGIKKEEIAILKKTFNNKQSYFKYDDNYQNIKRNSYTDIDKVLVKEIICMLGNGIDGYIARPQLTGFHEEIALCKPWEKLQFISLYKIFFFDTNECKIIGGKKVNKKKKAIKKNDKKVNRKKK
jgi:hypothetical protein